MDVAWLTTGLSAAEKPGHRNPVSLNQWEIGICAADFVCLWFFVKCNLYHSFNVFSFLVATTQCLFDHAENPYLIWSANFFLLKEIMEEGGSEQRGRVISWINILFASVQSQLNIQAPVIFNSLYTVRLKLFNFCRSCSSGFFLPGKILELPLTGRFTEFLWCVHELETNRLNFLRSYRTVNG